MDCPKCGHQQDATDKCESCGVYFAKLQPRAGVTRSTSSGRASRTAAAPSEPGIGPGALVVTAVITGVIVAAFMYGRGRSSAKSQAVPATIQSPAIQQPLPPSEAVPASAEPTRPAPAVMPASASASA